MLTSLVSRRSRVGRLVWLPGSSHEALNALASSTVHVAGIHLRDARTGDCNLGPAASALRDGGVVVAYASWEQGFVVARGNAKNLTSTEGLTKPGVRFVNREQGAGSRTLIDQMLRDADVPHSRVNGYADVARSHIAVGRAVAGGLADVGVGLRAVAHPLGLDFVPLVDVNFDLLIPNEHLAHPAIEALLDVLQTGALRAELAALPGYDCSQTGSVRARYGAAA
jgi:molybdate-binding protein